MQGCLDDSTWCDVVAGELRGWVYAGNILYPYQNSYAPMITWGPVIGMAITGFVLEDYWARHSWRSPWYPERHRWADRHWTAPRPVAPGAPVPRPYLAPGIQRPPGVAQPQRRPPGAGSVERPRTPRDNSGRRQPQYP